MNNLVDNTYVLPNLWGCIKYLIYKYNLKYLGLPIMYLAIIMFMVPINPGVVNESHYTSLDTFKTIAYTIDNKKEMILEKYNLTNEQFKVLVGVVLSEADHTYEDAYAVINTIYNRTHSKNWVKTVNNRFGKDKGTNLYYQAIAPGQFTVYASGSYKKRMNITSGEGYKAIIDFLYTEKVMHNFLSFRAHHVKVSNSTTFSENGNKYFGLIKEENRI